MGALFRLALTPRWLGYLALALCFTAACAGLGLWQLGRLSSMQAHNALVAANYHSPPVEMSAAGSWLSTWDGSKEWAPVSVRGRYLVEDRRIVRNRPRAGQPGYEVLVPFRLDSGKTVVIDRGWLPIGNRESGRPDDVPAPPTGELTVVGRLRTAEPPLDRQAPSGQLASIDLLTYSRALGYPLITVAYLQMGQETPAAAQNPAPFPEPSQDEGPHLSYALQWFAFGILFLIAWGYVLAQERHSPGGSSAQVSRDPRTGRRARPQGIDEREEDALLERQGL